jgi:ATP-dependent Clp protease adaptor protein ClpS
MTMGRFAILSVQPAKRCEHRRMTVKPIPTKMIKDAIRRAVRARRRDDEGKGAGRPDGSDTVVERRVRPETRTKKPPMYKVILLNDDYTPMEFVVQILMVVFHKDHAEATRIMLHVHQNGMGVAGVFPYEIAETKVRTVEDLARESEFPLKCVMEKA